MRILAAAFLAAATLVGCASDIASDPAWDQAKPPLILAPEGGAIRLLFVGDVMLGRSVAQIVDADPDGVFSGVRHAVSQADVAFLNLESPLTNRSHQSDSPNVLEADPASAGLLAAAGFDVAGLANNHSGDAGIEGIRDTVAALAGAGVRAIGVGRDSDGAAEPLLADAGSLRVAVLAFDLTWQGPSAGDEPGLAAWDPEYVRGAVGAARATADVVVVGIHGGIEYRTEGEDPIIDPAIGQLVDLGADVIWGHGPHVVQPIRTLSAPAGRTAVAAPSLGNFLFDQRIGATGSGAVFEVLVDAEGVLAYRIGRTDHSDLRVQFVGWELPTGNAVAVSGEWWELVGDMDWTDGGEGTTVAEGFPYGDVFDAAVGDITGDGVADIVVSYRYPFRETLANQGNRAFYADEQGRAAHFGVFEPETWRKIWAAGTVQRPIEAVQPCAAVIGFAYSDLDDPEIVATGAAVWGGLGFTFMPDLEGPGDLHCVDLDGDGILELVVTR